MNKPINLGGVQVIVFISDWRVETYEDASIVDVAYCSDFNSAQAKAIRSRDSYVNACIRYI